jgi:hypothetical protein
MSVASYINYHRTPFTKFMSISEYNEKHQAHIPQNAEFESGFRAALADARRVTDPHDYIQHHFNVEEMKNTLRNFSGKLGGRRSRGKSTVTNPAVPGASTVGNKGTVPARPQPDRPKYQLPATAKKRAPASTPPFNGPPNPAPAGGGGGNTPNPPAGTLHRTSTMTDGSNNFKIGQTVEYLSRSLKKWIQAQITFPINGLGKRNTDLFPTEAVGVEYKNPYTNEQMLVTLKKEEFSRLRPSSTGTPSGPGPIEPEYSQLTDYQKQVLKYNLWKLRFVWYNVTAPYKLKDISVAKANLTAIITKLKAVGFLLKETFEADGETYNLLNGDIFGDKPNLKDMLSSSILWATISVKREQKPGPAPTEDDIKEKPNPPGSKPASPGAAKKKKKGDEAAEDNRRIRSDLYNGNRSGKSTPSEEEVKSAFTTEEHVLEYLALALKYEGIRSSIQYKNAEYHTDVFKRHLASVKQIMANLSLYDDILETKNNQQDYLYQELNTANISIVPLGDTLDNIGSVADKRLQEFLSQLPYSSKENPPNKERYVKRGGKKSARVAEVKRILRVIKENPEEYAEFLYDQEVAKDAETKFKVARSDKFPHNGPLGVEDISLDDVLDEYGEEAEHYEEATTGVSSLHEEIDAYLKSNAKDDASFARDRAHVIHFNTVSTHLPARLMKGRDRYMKRLKAYLDGDMSAKVRMLDNTEVLVSALSPNADSLRALLKASSGEPRFCECT